MTIQVGLILAYRIASSCLALEWSRLNVGSPVNLRRLQSTTPVIGHVSGLKNPSLNKIALYCDARIQNLEDLMLETNKQLIIICWLRVAY